jgi:Xanthosine triphosphate pyrophosphatase
VLRYVTTNEGKIREAREYLGEETIEQRDFDYTEIQAPELEPIAAAGAREAYQRMAGPVIVDDAGLFIDDFEGFPGPYSSFVENTIGVERVWELAQQIDSAQASFRCVLAYCDGKSVEASPDPIDRTERAATVAHGDFEEADQDTLLPVKLFAGAVPGTIVAPRGDGGFGYDPIFEHDGETLAEMSTEQKNSLSHRGRALSEFAEWYSQRD